MYVLEHELQSAHVERVKKNRLDPKMILQFWKTPHSNMASVYNKNDSKDRENSETKKEIGRQDAL